MKVRKNNARRGRKTGFSLLELLAVVTILGIIAVVVIPRISVSSDTAKKNANKQNIAEINGAVERYYFENGTWPVLATLGGDANYFPDGLPTNPMAGTYALDGDNRVDRTKAKDL